MNIPYVGIFHCLCCGSVVDQELNRLPPFCCGIEMMKASERSVSHGESLIPRVVANRWVKTIGSRLGEPTPLPPAEFVARQPL